MVDQGPWLSSSNQRTGEDDRVEGDIVLTHELIKLYLIGILPPFFPILGVTSCDGGVALKEERRSWW